MDLLQWLGKGDLPKLTTRTVVGIIVAISGNILISLALNLQKLAHKQVGLMKSASRKATPLEAPDERDEDQDLTTNGDSETQHDVGDPASTTYVAAELQPLTNEVVSNYGTESTSAHINPKPKISFASRLNPMSRLRSKRASTRKFVLPVDIVSEDAVLHGLSDRRSKPSAKNDSTDAVDDNEGEYLKSKLWWLGFLLMNIGEMGNFISYAFAPASMVAPLGTFALMANCFFAPLLLGEYFRKRDLLGVIIAIIGAVTVVLASNASDVRLDPDALLQAICQTSFIVYFCIYAVGAITLAALSEGKIGRTYVFVDVGLCALFGGFTVLSTKALSTLLTLKWIEIFTLWITYPLMFVLVSTGVGQIRYLNRALMRFDSKVVIPIQFVLFTLSAIIGSAILYGDFKRAKFHEIVTFLYGCAATFAGVFIIAWSSPKDTDDTELDDNIDDAEGSANIIDSPLSASDIRNNMGSIGRRRNATLILPNGVSTPKPTPVLRHKRSGLSMMGISPAQHLLLVHSPPREVISRDNVDADIERSPSSYGRRRTMSWYGHDAAIDRSRTGTGSRTRDSSLVGAVRSGLGRAGSIVDTQGTSTSHVPR